MHIKCDTYDCGVPTGWPDVDMSRECQKKPSFSLIESILAHTAARQE